jgi:hypothetical protein
MSEKFFIFLLAQVNNMCIFIYKLMRAKTKTDTI